jgi:hypothetical protein
MPNSPEDLELAQLRAIQMTSETRVIVSFGARAGGFELTLQLRLDIMDRYGRRRIARDANGRFLRFDVSDESFCYLDAVTLAKDAATAHPQVELNYGSQAEPLWRKVDIYKMQNPFWDTFYPMAVKNAVVMIFQITKWWMSSEYCLQELAWFLVDAIQSAARGQPMACIFMVFGESKEEFAKLLNDLHGGFDGNDLGRTLVGEKYLRLIAILQPLLDDWAQAKVRNRASSKVHAARVIHHIRSRCVDVPKPSATLSFTDLYSESGQRLPQDPLTGQRLPQDPRTGAPVAAQAYTNQFDFNYSFDGVFRRKFFSLLDEDLRKSGIYPVHGHA